MSAVGVIRAQSYQPSLAASAGEHLQRVRTLQSQTEIYLLFFFPPFSAPVGPVRGRTQPPRTSSGLVELKESRCERRGGKGRAPAAPKPRRRVWRTARVAPNPGLGHPPDFQFWGESPQFPTPAGLQPAGMGAGEASRAEFPESSVPAAPGRFARRERLGPRRFPNASGSAAPTYPFVSLLGARPEPEPGLGPSALTPAAAARDVLGAGWLRPIGFAP